jgi:predicted TIM-barrel fold metal-dependent hydrolase
MTGLNVIDFHTHIFPPDFIARRQRLAVRDATFTALFSDPKARMATADDLVSAMDEDGVSTSVAMGIGWTDYGLAQEANDYLIESVRRHPERLVGFAGVNPAWGERAAREAERCAHAGLRGVGELHPDSQRFDLGNERTMAPLMEVVRELRLIVTTHSSEPVGHDYPGKGKTRPEALWRFIQSFPDVSLVCAHWGGGLPFYALMPEVAEALQNVYFDTAASPYLYSSKVYATVSALVGVEKILFGSDYPLLRASRSLQQVAESGLTDAEREMVTGGNAAALLGM